MNKTQTTKFETLVRRIEESNEQFANADRAEQIVMAAKDVLSLLQLGRIKATPGIWVAFDLTKHPKIRKAVEEGCQVSDLFKNVQMPTCAVCAVGGAMVAATLRLDKVPSDTHCPGRAVGWLGDGYSNYGYTYTTSTMGDNAREVFPVELLTCMDEAFEHQAFDYAQKTAHARLKAIYQNLIENEGKRFTAYKQPEVCLWHE